MTKEELAELLVSRGTNKNKYNLQGGIPVASEGIVLSYEHGKWHVKSFERGTWYTFGEYEEESDACDKVMNLLDDEFYRL